MITAERLHPNNQAWLSQFAAQPSHAVIVVLNHPSEISPVAEVLAKALNIPEAITINTDEALSIEDVRRLQQLAKLKKDSEEKHLFVLNFTKGVSNAAQNSLLKTFEEPPANTFIVITVNHASQALPTLRSRAQLLRILPLKSNDFIAQVRELQPQLDSATIKSHAAAYDHSFAAPSLEPDESLSKAREFLGASAANRLKQLKTVKQRPEAEQLVNQLLQISALTQRHTAQQGKTSATQTWVKITQEALLTQQALQKNGNVALQLQRLALALPELR